VTRLINENIVFHRVHNIMDSFGGLVICWWLLFGVIVKLSRWI